MSETTWVGVKPGDVAVPASRFRLALHRDVDLLAVGKEILTLGTAESGLDNWQTVINRFVERMPSSQLAFPIGNGTVNIDAGTAVVDVRLMTVLPGSVSVGEIFRELERFHAGAAVDRITRLGVENLEEITTGRETELEAATERADQNDLASRVLRGFRNLGLGVLVLAGVALLVYAAVIRPRTGAAA